MALEKKKKPSPYIKLKNNPLSIMDKLNNHL
jgi:hypothetical protein